MACALLGFNVVGSGLNSDSNYLFAVSQAEIECVAPAEAKQAEAAAEALHVTRRARHTSMSVGVVNIEEEDDEEDEDDGQAQAVQDLLGKIIKKNGNVDEQALKATPAESLEGAASGCLRSGWMRKEGSRNKSFKRRWFVLWRTPTLSEGDEAAAPVGKVTTMLIYYDDPKSTKANGLQLLTPGALKVAPPKKKRKEADFVVRLDHDDKKQKQKMPWKMVLAMDSDAELQLWVATLQEACAK